MDFLLTEKGDLLLEEINVKAQPIALSFFIKPSSHAICLKFDIEDKFITTTYSGILIDFSIKHYETMYSALTVDDTEAIKQLCYSAIRTQKNSLTQANEYGSYFYQYKNKKITTDLLKQLEVVAKNAINSFAPEAAVTASAVPTQNGAATIRFDIQIYQHALTLDYLI